MPPVDSGQDVVSRATKDAPRVAFQGEPGAFSEIAIQKAWPGGAHAHPCTTFDEALARLLDRTVDFAIIPLENAIAGPVKVALTALEANEAQIRRVMELRVSVHLCLMAPQGATLAGLRIARSHPVALAQCRIFLARHSWITPEGHYDTAGAARDVARENDVTIGAVASEAAASQYQLTIIARNVEDVSANWTRFAVVELR
jgi:prephenate dehydratase